MTRSPFSRIGSTLLIAALVVGLSGCKRVPGHQGFITDAALIDGIKAGVDNRDSVEKTLGRPTFVGQFDATDWYYVARDTKTYAYKLPKPTAEKITHVRFDTAGNVVAVEKTGMDKVVTLRPVRDKTPTLGRNRTLLEDIFGNIGQVGAVGKGGTADNPDGK